jgi:hypothetical protein
VTRQWAGEQQSDGALRTSGEYEGKTIASKQGQHAGGERSDWRGAPDEPSPGGAYTSHHLVPREQLPEGHGDHAAGGDAAMPR